MKGAASLGWMDGWMDASVPDFQAGSASSTSLECPRTSSLVVRKGRQHCCPTAEHPSWVYNQASLGADRKQPSLYCVLWLTAPDGKPSPLTNYRSPFTQGKHLPFHRDQSETTNGSSSEPPLPSWLSKPSRHAAGRTPHLWAPQPPTAPCHSQTLLGARLWVLEP